MKRTDGGELPPVESLRWLWGLVLVAATILAYQPAWNAGFIWDDDYYVTNNPLITEPDGLKRIWFSTESPSQYFPLTYTVFRIEHALWGMNPSGYHWVNILLHAANALLLWRLLRRLNIPGAWLAAGIFALHPVHVESVAWITELKNVLSLLFFLLALRTWVEFTEGKISRWNYGLTLLFYTLALLSKTTACTLPAALLLVLWLKRQPITRARLAQVFPFVILGLAMGLLTIWWERHHQHTIGAGFEILPLERLLLASRAVWFYLGKLLWPADLAFSYSRWSMNPASPLAYVWLAAGLGLCGVVWFARRFLGRGPEVALAFFVLTLSPLLGFLMLYTFRYASVADHYQYVASIGPIALAAAAITWRLGRTRQAKLLQPVLGAILLIILALLTWRQSTTYKDPETLWRATIARNPTSSLAYNNLGTELRRKGDADGALVCYQKALDFNPKWAEPHINIGNVLRSKGRFDEAVAHYHVALENEPGQAEAHYNLGIVLLEQGLPDEAVARFTSAVELRPRLAPAHISLGDAALNRGDLDEAIARYQTALKIDSSKAPVHINLGTALMRKGEFLKAAAQYQLALELDPAFAGLSNNLRDLAWTLATHPNASVRNGTLAIDLALHANRISGGTDPFIVGTLAAAYGEAGHFQEAIATARKAVELGKAQSNTNLVESLAELIRAFENGAAVRSTEGP